MKKGLRILVITLMLSLILPFSLYAAPEGYMEVALTKKNFKQYFGIKKIKGYDFEHRRKGKYKYEGYSFQFYSKLLKKGYVLYGVKNFSIKATCRITRKHRKGAIKTSKTTYRSSRIHHLIEGEDKDYTYKYGKLSKFKIKSVKGTAIFIKPDNIIRKKTGIGWYDEYQNMKIKFLQVKVKHPYNPNILDGPDEFSNAEGVRQDADGFYWYDLNLNMVGKTQCL